MPFDIAFLDKSYGWLTDKEIKYLTMTPDITREGQHEWFDSLPSKADYKIWGVECDGVPVGVCGLKHITTCDGEYWGYIGEKEYWGRGVGCSMMDFIESYARSLGLKSVYLNVRKDNPRAIALYLKRGFRALQEEHDVIKMMLEL